MKNKQTVNDRWQKSINNVGRKTKKTPEVVRKLVAAFHNDYDLSDALVYASISKTTYYDWLKKDKKFSEEIEASKHVLSMRCKMVITDRINNGDVKAAMWWLEHRRPEEFSLQARFSCKRVELAAPIIFNPDKNEEYLEGYRDESEDQE